MQEDFSQSLGFDSVYGFDSFGYDYDGFLKRNPAKKAAAVQRKQNKVENKAAKKAAKIVRKDNKAAAKIERKANRPRVQKIRAKIADQEARTKAEIAEMAAQGAADREQAALDGAAAREPEQMPQEEQDYSAQFPPEQQVKVKNYLKRRGRAIEAENPAILAAQFREERGRQINERYNEKIDWLDENSEANEDEWYEENYPEYEDVEEEILEEEENEFGFTGDEDNFLDPDTIAVATNVGKKAADLYRQKRFAQGKKAFGMTKAAYDKKQEAQRKALAEGTDTLSQLKGAAVQEGTRQFIGRNAAPIIIGVVLLTAAIAGVIYLNKSKN